MSGHVINILADAITKETIKRALRQSKAVRDGESIGEKKRETVKCGYVCVSVHVCATTGRAYVFRVMCVRASVRNCIIPRAAQHR